MTAEILGRRETQRLELKSQKILVEDRSQIAREVVGILNEGGGEVWIGVEEQDSVAVEIALDPGLTGNRQAGRHFARSSSPPKPAKSRIEWELWSEHWRRTVSRTKVYESGALQFWAALDRLRGPYTEDREIWPLTLLEYTVSAFRMARVIYRGCLGPDDLVATDLALIGIGGWGLRGGTPEDDFLTNSPHRLEVPDLLWDPESFSFREIDETPDRCGFRLLRRVYQAFGWREEDMPRQFDRESGRLILPE